jgi:hypothetical protein
MIDSLFVYRWQNKGVVGWGQTNSILGGGATGRGVPQILNLEARTFWQRFVSPNHPQKLFQNM